jgi:alpha-beta hydrolase superfamily lysophospholipase
MTAENAPDPAAPDTIVLVHGFWVTPRSWEKWVERYEGRGYRVLSPPTLASRSRRCARTPRP